LQDKLFGYKKGFTATVYGEDGPPKNQSSSPSSPEKNPLWIRNSAPGGELGEVGEAKFSAGGLFTPIF
jgi:hypothetical protein